jgi:hypothetical protein
LALQYFLNHDTDIRGKVPVGFPVEGIEILLLNEAGGQAENVYGEIGIRSAHLALGYWRRPQLTDAAFQSDPDGGTRRIFRTGDMGRLLPNGAVAFLGRKDFQVKIRGFRVELAEVESVLSQHPGLRETVVVARTDEVTETQLVAYVVPKHEHNLPATDLYSYMKLTLPDYMIPSAFVFLDAIPRTPNGKVDRRRLPLPDRSNAGMENTFVQPRTRHEAFLAGVWTDILGLDRVGVQNNFFELGGHSLLAAQVISQVRNAFQIDLPLRTIFERPTIEELAVIILQDQARNVGQDEIGELLTELEALSEDEAESRKILEANH